MNPQDWEERFKNKFGNYGLYGDYEYMGFKDNLPEVVKWVREERQAVADGLLGRLWDELRGWSTDTDLTMRVHRVAVVLEEIGQEYGLNE